MFSKKTVTNPRYESEDEKQKIDRIADRLFITSRCVMYNILGIAVANIKNENDVEQVMKEILEIKSELEKQHKVVEQDHYESIIFNIYYDLKINPQIKAIYEDESNPFASMEKNKLNRIIIDYLAKIKFHMSINNINSINTMTLEEIFGKDSSIVQYIIDCSPFMMKDSQTNYRFISDYVKNSIMAKYSVSTALNIKLSGIPDFEDDENLIKREIHQDGVQTKFIYKNIYQFESSLYVGFRKECSSQHTLFITLRLS